ncbi:hypothetical protein FOXG_11431 [Fusarium oxysporum f. sp. lycopersici 4287]|uniref:Uncharacterized protein n=2 Tax=Fusarium oxysporum TaxID=5507 RepID=A0A0J9WQY3_FUSO4|nr:hypothetical protein FOXG_11431 [Fusarium oxysporum f. sp. lycopersici 4287]KNB11582.1 hypothetical protein FOXG_11431 [Fusarium oxysporum f. sp. lycopersici 4287]
MTIQQQFDYYVSEPGAPMPEEHFSDGGIDCGEHGDFDAEDRQDVISIDSTDAIMVGEYPQSSTHSFDWEPRQGVVSESNETRLVCGPWPQPEFMPNIDSRGSLKPSPLECPKANLQEIFATFFDHILWTRGTDVHSFKNKSLRTNDGADRLKPVMSLKNTQMGSTPAPFINPALLADEPCWSNEISDARKNDMEWLTQPLHPLLRHPPSILMHTNDGPGSRDTPLNAIIGPSGVPRAPNFGNRLQPARTEIPGEKFHMAIIESHTVIDQLGTLELEDSGEEGTILKRRRMVLKTRMTLRWTKIELLDSGVIDN